jgi:hypothetical protein
MPLESQEVSKERIEFLCPCCSQKVNILVSYFLHPEYLKPKVVETASEEICKVAKERLRKGLAEIEFGDKEVEKYAGENLEKSIIFPGEVNMILESLRAKYGKK